MKIRYKKSDIPELCNKRMLFDTNVLIYIFWPTGTNNWIRDYSSILSKLIKNKNQIFVDFIIISEVINRAIRIEYDKHLNQFELDRNKFSFKEFRNSAEGKNAINDVYQVISKKVFSIFKIIGKNFLLDDIKSFLIVDNTDFNDKAIELLCKENDLILVTNDFDFKNSEIEILTSNNRLLSSNETHFRK